jgi:internalin A
LDSGIVKNPMLKEIFMSDVIELDDFFAEEHFKTKTITKAELAKAAHLFCYDRKGDGELEKRFPIIPLDICQYMPNLKEFMLGLKSFTNWKHLSALSSLNDLVIWYKEINSELASIIANLPKLRKLTLSGLFITDYDTLSESKTLTQLRLNSIKDLKSSHIEKFTHLTQLSIGNNEFDVTEGIAKLSKLKKLEYEKTPIKSLDFLKNLKNLEVFRLQTKTDDSSLTEIFSILKKLKEFEYPLQDLSLVKTCPKLTSIYIDGTHYKNISALQASAVTSIMVMDAPNEKRAKEIIAEVEKYCKLGSSGYNMPWKDK